MNDHPDHPDSPELAGRSAQPNGRIKPLVMLVLLAVVAYVGGNGMVNAWKLQRRIECSKRMQGIAAGLTYYGYAFDRSRDSPIAFLQAHGADPHKLKCPRHPGATSNYVVVGFVSGASGAKRRVAMFEPLSNHDGAGANVLFVDGHAEFVNPRRFDELIDQRTVTAGRDARQGRDASRGDGNAALNPSCARGSIGAAAFRRFCHARSRALRRPGGARGTMAL